MGLRARLFRVGSLELKIGTPEARNSDLGRIFPGWNPVSLCRNTFLGALAVISLAKGKVEKGG
jgi:hypothetical protein